MVEELGLSPREIMFELKKELAKAGSSLDEKAFNAIVAAVGMAISANNDRILRQLRASGMNI